MSRFKVQQFRLKVHPPHCPICAKLLDGATNIGPNPGRPQKGDVSLCVYCQVPLVFLSRHTLRVMQDGEWLALDERTRTLLTACRDKFRTAMRDDPPPEWRIH